MVKIERTILREIGCMRKNKNGLPVLATTRQSAKQMYKKVHEAYLKSVLQRENNTFFEKNNSIQLNDNKSSTKHKNESRVKNYKKIIQELLQADEIPFYPEANKVLDSPVKAEKGEVVEKYKNKQVGIIKTSLENDVQLENGRKQSNTKEEGNIFIEEKELQKDPLCTEDGLYEDIRALLKGDLFYLLVYGMNRKDMDKDWLFERCRDVQKNPNDFLDLWAREHYKSTIITIGLTIQNILNNPNITVGIFSHTRPIAKAFLRQIKREWETNSLLRAYFPHISAPEKSEARTRTWSEDGGLIVKRDGNPKEATLEAWGLVDGQPTGKHFDLLLYDDVVTLESVSTPEQIKKTTDAWRLSLNLGARNGHLRMIGTRYHATDTYHLIMEQGSVIPRVHPATKDGLSSGEAVFLDNSLLAKKRRDMGPYVFACQMLQNPLADNAMGFKKEWFQTLPSTGLWEEHISQIQKENTEDKNHVNNFIDNRVAHTCSGFQAQNIAFTQNPAHGYSAYKNPQYLGVNMNRYIVVDPASSKKESSDYTSMWVVGLNHDGFYYVLDGVHDRLALHERAEALFSLHKKHSPLAVGYEQYGIQADIEHIKYRMEQENYRFSIIPLGGSMAKSDRIRRLVPIFEQGRLWFPHRLAYLRVDRSTVDLVQEFYKKEYVNFPVAGHDDMLDCLSRILDSKLGAVFPMRQEVRPQSSHNFFV